MGYDIHLINTTLYFTFRKHQLIIWQFCLADKKSIRAQRKQARYLQNGAVTGRMCEETANKSGLIKLCGTIMIAMSIQQLELFKNYKIMGEWRHVSRYLLWKLAKFPGLGGRCLYLANCQMWSESKLRLKNQVVSLPSA